MGRRYAMRHEKHYDLRPLRKISKPSFSPARKLISKRGGLQRGTAFDRGEVKLWMADSDDSIKVAKDNFALGNYHVSAFYTHQAVEKALKAAIIAFKHKIPLKTHSLKDLHLEVADEVVLTDEQKDFLGELTPASQVARYVDVAVGLPREAYSKRLAEEYLNKALPIIDAVKTHMRDVRQR